MEDKSSGKDYHCSVPAPPMNALLFHPESAQYLHCHIRAMQGQHWPDASSKDFLMLDKALYGTFTTPVPMIAHVMCLSDREVPRELWGSGLGPYWVQ